MSDKRDNASKRRNTGYILNFSFSWNLFWNPVKRKKNISLCIGRRNDSFYHDLIVTDEYIPRKPQMKASVTAVGMQRTLNTSNPESRNALCELNVAGPDCDVKIRSEGVKDVQVIVNTGQSSTISGACVDALDANQLRNKCLKQAGLMDNKGGILYLLSMEQAEEVLMAVYGDDFYLKDLADLRVPCSYSEFCKTLEHKGISQGLKGPLRCAEGSIFITLCESIGMEHEDLICNGVLEMLYKLVVTNVEKSQRLEQMEAKSSYFGM